MTSSHDRDWRVGVCSSIRMLDANLWMRMLWTQTYYGMLDTSQLLGCSIQYLRMLSICYATRKWRPSSLPALAALAAEVRTSEGFLLKVSARELC